MYTRQDVCRLTGIGVERFKGLARREQLATISIPKIGITDAIRDHAKERGWNWFSAIDVFLIAVQEQLSREMGYSNGLGPEDAARIVWNNSGELGEVFWTSPSSGVKEAANDVWVGYAAFDGPTGQNNGGRNLIGSLSKLLERTNSSEDRFARVFLVNADAVLRNIESRAALNSIEYLVGKAALDAKEAQEAEEN